VKERLDSGDERYHELFEQLSEALRSGGVEELHQALVEASRVTSRCGDVLLAV
jgi:hypothetical protein